MLGKRTKFNQLWFKEEAFRRWLKDVPEDQFAFRCKWCAVTLDLGNMGKSALSRHTKSAKHNNLEKAQESESTNFLDSLTRPASQFSQTNQNSSETSGNQTRQIGDAENHTTPPDNNFGALQIYSNDAPKQASTQGSVFSTFHPTF